MSDCFTSQKFAWLRQIAIDPGLSAAAKSVGTVIGTDFMNREKGCAWPAMSTLAACVGLALSTTRTAIRKLEDRGHLRVEQGRGRSSTSLYYWIIKEADEGTATDKTTDGPVVNLQKTTEAPVPLQKKPPESERENHRNQSAKTTGSPVPIPLKDSFERDSYELESYRHTPKGAEPEFVLEVPCQRSTSDPRAKASEGRDAWKAGFDEFYQHYPRKKARGAAERAYKAAIKIERHEVILAACMRFSASEAGAYANGKEPRFTPHPATWLNQRRWEDQPESPVQLGHRAPTASDRKAGLANIASRLLAKGKEISCSDGSPPASDRPQARLMGAAR